MFPTAGLVKTGFSIDRTAYFIYINSSNIFYDSVAQLGERYLDRVEVVGSSPIGIIPQNPY